MNLEVPVCLHSQLDMQSCPSGSSSEREKGTNASEVVRVRSKHRIYDGNGNAKTVEGVLLLYVVGRQTGCPNGARTFTFGIDK